jgi:hypothetical protein
VAAADPRAAGAYDVADGALDVFGTAAAAPFDPESVRREFVSEPFPPGKWQERLDRAKSGGSYGPYEGEPEPIGPPLPGEPDMRPYRGLSAAAAPYAPLGPTHGYEAPQNRDSGANRSPESASEPRPSVYEAILKARAKLLPWKQKLEKAKSGGGYGP